MLHDLFDNELQTYREFHKAQEESREKLIRVKNQNLLLILLAAFLLYLAVQERIRYSRLEDAYDKFRKTHMTVQEKEDEADAPAVEDTPEMTRPD